MTNSKLLDAIGKNKLILGASATIKLLKANEADEIYLVSTCPDNLKTQIKFLAKTNNIPVTELKENSEELATLAKKPFSISVASIRKAKEKE